MMTTINLDESNAVVCRPALEKDRAEVLELCSHIWEGNDYVPEVWDEWLADPEGMLGVAEMGGRVVGIFKLTKFQEREWYLEGLRVHPDMQGKGIAAHIHEYVLATWHRMGSGILRLTTASFNTKVHHMCERTGFKRIAEFTPYRAPQLADKTEEFTAVKVEEAKKALQFVLSSQAHALSAGLINLGWVYADPQLKHLEESIKDGHAWWWKDGRGFISIWEDDDEEGSKPAIQLVACEVSDLCELLADYRKLMSMLGYKSAGWVAPNHPEVLHCLEKTGFEQSWDISIYVYELSGLHVIGSEVTSSREK